jgi:hypothetical protein
LSRFNCHFKDNNTYNEYLDLKAQTEDSHLLFGAPECAKKVFYGETINSEYINNKYFIVIASIIGIIFA